MERTDEDVLLLDVDEDVVVDVVVVLLVVVDVLEMLLVLVLVLALVLVLVCVLVVVLELEVVVVLVVVVVDVEVVVELDVVVVVDEVVVVVVEVLCKGRWPGQRHSHTCCQHATAPQRRQNASANWQDTACTTGRGCESARYNSYRCFGSLKKDKCGSP